MVKFINKTLRSMITIGMGVQIVFGLLWIGCNIGPGCMAEETVLYETAAGNMIVDEYVGILYPLLVRFSQTIMGILGLPYECFLYLLQLGVAFICYYAFVRLCRRPSQNDIEKWKACFVGLFLLTIPLCVQWHLTILPRSFASSLYLLLLGICVRGLWQKNERTLRWWYRICVLWVLMTLLMPQYWWFGLLPVLVAALSYVKENRKNGIVKCIVAMVIAAILSGGMNHVAQEPGSSNRIQKSVGAALVSRLVWPYFEIDYYFWPDEIKLIMDEMEARTISDRADHVAKIFGPLVEEVYGREKANELYWDMALKCFSVRTKEILQLIAEDFVAYLGAPWSVKQQLDGTGLSYSGWNYGNMRENTPTLTKWYVDFGLVGFRIGYLLAVVIGIQKIWENRKTNKKLKSGPYMLLIVSVLFQATWYTMSAAGMMDYGNVPELIILWYLPIAFLGGLKEECICEE